MKTILFIILLITAIYATPKRHLPKKTERDYYTHWTPTEGGALCQDGTPHGLFVQDGTERDVIIFLEGGGYCAGWEYQQTIDSCAGRIGRDYRSSSRNWGETMDRVKFFSQGMLSGDSEQNPKFWAWKKIFVPYLDGTLHSGYSEDVHYSTPNENGESQEVYFRGFNNTMTSINYLFDELNLSNARRVIFTGGSAGALGNYMWMNELKSRLSPEQKLYVVPDSGLFPQESLQLPQSEILTSWKVLTDIAWPNGDIIMPRECAYKDIDDERWKCAFPEYNAETWRSDIPVLLVESLYDAWTLAYFYQLPCLEFNPYTIYNLEKCTEQEMEQANRLATITEEFVDWAIESFENVSAYTIACVEHVFVHNNVSFYSKDWKIQGRRLGQAIKQWMNVQYKKNDCESSSSESSEEGYDEDDVEQMNFLENGRRWPQNAGCARL